MIRKLIISLSFFMLVTAFSYSQNSKKEISIFVKSFFNDIFKSDKPLDIISNEYRLQKCSKIKSKEDANTMFKKNITFLKSEKKHLFKKKNINFSVENYNESSFSDMWEFEKKHKKNIYVIRVDNRIESYVLIKKIKLFHLFTSVKEVIV